MGRKSSLKRKRKMSRNRGTAVAPASPPSPPPTTRAHLGTSGYWVPEDAKLSTRLGQVAQVFIDQLPDDAPFDAKRTAYEFAAVAWNYDLLGDVERAAGDFIEGGLGRTSAWMEDRVPVGHHAERPCSAPSRATRTRVLDGAPNGRRSSARWSHSD